MDKGLFIKCEDEKQAETLRQAIREFIDAGNHYMDIDTSDLDELHRSKLIFRVTSLGLYAILSNIVDD